MYKTSLAAVLVILFASNVIANEVILVSGNVTDAYADKIHFYVNDNFMEIEKVPKKIMKIIWELDREKIITLKIKKSGEKNIFVSLEEQ